MDTVDKKILFSLLKDGRKPQRQIAKEIGISAQTLNYRMAKMIDEGIIEGFSVHANSRIFGKVAIYAAYQSEESIQEGYFLKLNCLGNIAIYGFDGESTSEVEEKIALASRSLGKPVKIYTPPQNFYSGNSKNVDFQFIEELRKTPRVKISEIAKRIDMPVIRIKRRYNFLRKNYLVTVFAKINLSKTDMVIFSINSSDREKIEQVLDDVAIFKIIDNSAGTFICFSENMAIARALISSSEQMDKTCKAIIISGYEFIY